MKLDFEHKTGKQGVDIVGAIDLTGCHEHVEWSIMEVNASYHSEYYDCCPDGPFVDITFSLKLRRKFRFYIINLIIPCVCINFATICNFYVPSESTEKIILCISILINLAVFQVGTLYILITPCCILLYIL